MWVLVCLEAPVGTPDAQVRLFKDREQGLAALNEATGRGFATYEEYAAEGAAALEVLAYPYVGNTRGSFSVDPDTGVDLERAWALVEVDVEG